MEKINDDDIEDSVSIGSFQIQLLLQLAFQPKYGYEIINDLKLNNINVSSGQIYPALKKLVNSGHLATFNQRGRAARRKYYKITNKGIQTTQRIILNMLTNLIPIIYSSLEDIKSKLFEQYRIKRGDIVLLHSFLIKQAIIDLARLVGDTGKILITVKNEESIKLISDLAIFYNFEKVIQSIMITGKNEIKCQESIADQAVLMLFQKEKNLNSLLDGILKVLKPNGKLILLSTKLNIFSETFLSFFDFFKFIDFFDGYTMNELQNICTKFELEIERTEDIKKIFIIEARKKRN